MLGAPAPHDTFVGDNRYADPAHQAAEARERQEDREMRAARGDPGNVSTSSADNHSASETTTEKASTSLDASPVTLSTSRTPHVAFEQPADSISYPDRLEEEEIGEQGPHTGSSTPRARSTSRVRFDLGSNVAHSPDDSRHHRQLSTDDSGGRSRDRDGPNDEHRTGRSRNRRPSSTLMNDPYERRTSGSDSDETVDLPARFDEHGNRKPDTGGHDLAARLSEMFGGSSHSNSSSRRRSRERGSEGSGSMMEQIIHGIAGEFFHNDGRPDRRSR